MAKVFVIYLLVMNIHTYFYNHVWSERAIKAKARNIEHVQRRLISLLLSNTYNIASYMYLYGIGFKTYFHVEANFNSRFLPLIHSISTTFTGSSDFIKPISDTELFIQISQTIISFIFLTIILAKSDNLEED